MVPNTEWRVLDCVQSVFLLRSLSFLVDLVATLQSHTTRGCFSSIPLNRPSPFSRPLFLRLLRPRPPQLQGSPLLGHCTWQHRLDQTSCLCTAITKATPPQTSLSSPQKTWSESNRFSVRLFYFEEYDSFYFWVCAARCRGVVAAARRADGIRFKLKAGRSSLVF